jgi:hypothetical protein
MLDPFSLIGAISAVVSLLDCCARATGLISTYFKEAQEIHETLQLLSDELRQLQNGLETIYETLDNMPNVLPTRFRNALKEAVEDCERKLNTLLTLLQQIHDSRTRFGAKYKYDVNFPKIRRQIESIDRCRQSLLLCLTLLNMYTSCNHFFSPLTGRNTSLEIRIHQQHEEDVQENQNRLLNSLVRHLGLAPYAVDTATRPQLPPITALTPLAHGAEGTQGSDTTSGSSSVRFQCSLTDVLKVS